MKKHIRYIPALVAVVVLLGTCINVLNSPEEPGTVPGGTISRGKGRLAIQVGDGARTALPSGTFDKYVLRFTYTGTEGYTHSDEVWSDGLAVDLEPGNWTVYADAYVGTVVSGTGSTAVTVSVGTVMSVTIRIGLNPDPLITGTLKYTVSYPIDPLAPSPYGEQKLFVSDMAGAPVANETVTNGVETDLSLTAGVYLIQVRITDNIQHTSASRGVVVHIYGGMESSLDITIGPEEFTALVPVTVTVGLTPSTITMDRWWVMLYGDAACNELLGSASPPASGEAVTLWVDSSRTSVYIRQEVTIGWVTLNGHLETVGLTGEGKGVNLNDTLFTVNPDAGIPAGMVTSAVPAAFVGNSVEVTVTPETGYALKTGTLKYSYGGTDASLSGTGPEYTFTMPASDVTVSAEFEAVIYDITPDTLSNGAVSVNPATATMGTLITLTVTPDTGYKLKIGTLKYLYEDEERSPTGSGTTYTFTMPASDVTVYAEFEAVIYTITVDTLSNGAVSTNPTSAAMGTTITLTVTPDTGYVLKSGTLKYSHAGGEGSPTGSGPDYTFTMPASDVTVKAEFYQVAWYVTAGSSAGDGTAAAPYGTMAEALAGIAAAYADSSWPNKGSASATPARIVVTGTVTETVGTSGMVEISDTSLYTKYPPIILEGTGTLDAYSLSKRVLYINKADVTLNGSLTLTRGTVTGGNGGGGVQVLDGSFTMSGGTISSNTATFGGGVSVAGGSFTMNGGTISGNTADTYGGGVYVGAGAGTFKKEPGSTPGNSGTINGGGVSQANTAGSGIGHAVYVSEGSKARNSTAGTGTNLDSTIPGTTGGWEIVAWVDIVNTISAATAGSSVAVPGGTYTVTETLTVDKNITITPAAGAAVTFKRASTVLGDMIQVTGGVLTLDKGTGSSLTLDGNGDNVTATGSLVRVESGSLTMNSDVTLTNNKKSDNGSGVYVAGSSGFTMTGGIISGNKVTVGHGGGVVFESGTFAMSGGTITQNEAAGVGGGVTVGSGTFTMSGGTISDNKAITGDGGGVYANGTFNLRGGTISGNQAGGTGGGVLVNSTGTFTMSGGTIRGNQAITGGGVYVGDTATFKKEDSVTSGNSGIIYGDDDTTHTLDSDENTAVNYGHAVYVQNGGKKRDNTAGAAVNLDSADSAGTNNWD